MGEIKVELIEATLKRPLLCMASSKENCRIIAIPKGSVILFAVKEGSIDEESKKEIEDLMKEFLNNELGA